MRNLDATITSFLTGLDDQGRRRHLRDLRPIDAAHVQIDGKSYINFSGNDYLGLSQHPALVERAKAWAERYGAGSAASRLVTGNLDIFSGVERKIAELKQTETALILASGFQANASVLPALLTGGLFVEKPLVFCDRLNHASMHHGLMAAGVRQIRFRHNDFDHLEDLLKAKMVEPGPRFIVTETVFSMDGDRADVARLSEIAERYDAFLYLDEAHATGVLGPGGAGLSLDAQPKADLVMGTFSKALGGFGAYIACSENLKSYLVNKAGGLIYATALPPAVLGAMDAALDLLPSLEADRAKLIALADQARTQLAEAGLSTGPSTTQILPVLLGSEQTALDLAKRLEDDGILAIAIRPPTVPNGESRLRLAFSAAHEPHEIAYLCQRIAHHYAELT